MNIDVILRTHDVSEIHPKNDNKRYCDHSKTDVIKKCVNSLVKTCNRSTHNIRIIWIDDHSSETSLANLKNIFSTSNHEVIQKPLTDSTGHNASALVQFTECKNSTADLVYNVEDDYLHDDDCMNEMVDTYIRFKEKFNVEVAIHPFDDPDNYKDELVEPNDMFCRILLGSKRHWRTNTYTTYTFLTNPKVVRDNWQIFYKLARLYLTPLGFANNINESSTINKIWKNQVCLFTPIPSLALHMQYEQQKDKFIDWKLWWDKN